VRITTSKDNETHKEESSGTKYVLQNWKSGRHTGGMVRRVLTRIEFLEIL
jgi:hypothetical protein